MVKIKLRIKMNKDLKVLILDDSETIRKTERKIIHALGFLNVYEAETIKGGEDIINKENIGFFVLDWNLPDGIGLNFLKTIRKIDKFKDTPVLMVTTEDDVSRMLEAIEEGASGYSTKPIDVQDFVEKFQNAYERHYINGSEDIASKTTTKARKLQTQPSIGIKTESKMPKTLSFLIVDDSIAALKEVVKVLKASGFTGDLITASSVSEAKEHLSKKSVSIILSDWNMPDESGIEFLEYLKGQRRFSNIPFIMITANSEPKQILKAIESGATEYLAKPWTPEDLNAKIQSTWLKYNAKSYKLNS
ncbi:MAG: response regulator [Bacteriovoracaceae bacterium]